MESVYKQDGLTIMEQAEPYIKTILSFEEELDKAIKAKDKMLVSLYKESIDETLNELSHSKVTSPDGRAITMKALVMSEVVKRKAENKIEKEKSQSVDGRITNISSGRRKLNDLDELVAD